MNIIQKSDVSCQQKHGLRFASKMVSIIGIGAICTLIFSVASAQDTDSRIFGKAPTDGTITVHSDMGFTRHGTVSGKGRYALSELRPGTYVVSLEKDGKTLASQPGVPLFVGRGSEVDFDCSNDQCSASIAR